MPASDLNISNPRTITFIPATKDTNGNVIVPDDYTFFFAPSDADNTPPTFSAASLSAKVPTKDLAVQVDGLVHVPIADLNLPAQLAVGTWGCMGETNLGTALSTPSNVAFFNIAAPIPLPPTNVGFSAA